MDKNYTFRSDPKRTINSSAISFLCGVTLCLLPGIVSAQISGYVSATRGYDKNPMCNSVSGSDQVTEGYFQFQYETEKRDPLFRLLYVGALMRFNALRDRDYYEHALSVLYAHSSNSSEEDSSGRYFDLTTRIMTRHDREIAQDFNNTGIGCSASYKSIIGKSISIGFINDLQYRQYHYVEPLSNIIDVLTVEAGNSRGSSFRYGGFISTGVKYYTNNEYDTTRFVEPVTPGNNGNGKGKGLGNQNSSASGFKKTLFTVAENTSIQVTGGLVLWKTWEQASLGGHVLLRINPLWVTRYLANEAASTILTDDIYNDFMSYEGLELRLNGQCGLPLDLQVKCAFNLQQKKFNVPAISLDGVESTVNREDLRMSIEASISRNITLSEIFSIDAALNFHQVRNQSNDEYNDFSGHAVSLSVGLGF
jgi:hypothetical protein